MKAIDYYNKYEHNLFDTTLSIDSIVNVIGNLMREMAEEVVDICKTRHARYDSAVYPVVVEQNLKWNAICALLEKNKGISPLKRDGFKNYWFKEVPELKKYEEAQYEKRNRADKYHS